MSQAEIRILSPADAAEYWQVRLRALKEEPDSFGSAFEEASQTAASDVLRKLAGGEDSFVIGAFQPELVGTVGFVRKEGLKMRHKGIIWGMYVCPEARGQGIARSLMVAAIARASTIDGLNALLLTVVTTKIAARKLYTSLGFAPYGIESRTLKVESAYVDEEMMELQLSEHGNR